MMTLTRRFAFSAAHRLHSTALDATGNACHYGPCENIHGHNYALEVSVEGRVDPTTGFFCNVMELKSIVDRLVVDVYDHRLLNDLPQFQGVITTMENIAQVIWQQIQPALAERGMVLTAIQLGETPDHWVRIIRD